MKISKDLEQGCSIIIPTWNNFKYITKCVESIQKYSNFNHEIILHINDGSDGTLNYAIDNNIKFSYSKKNIGVCKSMNNGYKLSSKKIIFYFNDDMIALPEWDLEIFKFCQQYDIPKESLISSTMIEPKDNNICCLAPRNYGLDIDNFELDRLLNDLPLLKTLKPNVNGSTWPPNMIHRDLWEKINGYSEEFSPGFGSDPDIAKKLYDIGVRNFIGIGSSLVYHFMCKTTSNKSFIHNNGELQFYIKHRMSINYFVYMVLKRGTPWNYK
jgi:glycosyltransferase involved in cell wall biosynthesis